MSRLKSVGEWLRAGWVSPEPDSPVLRLEEPSVHGGLTPEARAPRDLSPAAPRHASHDARGASHDASFVRKLPNTFRNRKVVHESGHALVAWLCTHALVTELDVESTAGNGKVAYFFKYDPARISDLAWVRVVIGLGGVAGELRMLGNFRTGHASRDLAMAREDAIEVKDIPTVLGEHVTLFDRKIFEVPLEDFERRLLNAALTLAKRLIAEHDGLYMKLVERCMTRDRLSEEEIAETLGSREHILFLKKVGLLTFWTKDYHG